MPRIPGSEVSPFISTSVPTPSVNVEGDMALGQALNRLGDVGSAIATNEQAIIKDAITKAYVRDTTADHELKLSSYTEELNKRAKITSDKGYHIPAGEGLPDGTLLDKDTSYSDAIAKMQDNLMNEVIGKAPTETAKQSYLAKMQPQYVKNNIQSRSHELNVTTKYFGDQEDAYHANLAKSVRDYGKVNKINGQTSALKVTDLLAAEMARITENIGTHYTPVTAELKKQELANRFFNEFLEGRKEAILLSGSKLDKDEMLLEMGTLINSTAGIDTQSRKSIQDAYAIVGNDRTFSKEQYDKLPDQLKNIAIEDTETGTYMVPKEEYSNLLEGKSNKLWISSISQHIGEKEFNKWSNEYMKLKMQNKSDYATDANLISSNYVAQAARGNIDPNISLEIKSKALSSNMTETQKANLIQNVATAEVTGVVISNLAVTKPSSWEGQFNESLKVVEEQFKDMSNIDPALANIAGKPGFVGKMVAEMNTQRLETQKALLKERKEDSEAYKLKYFKNHDEYRVLGLYQSIFMDPNKSVPERTMALNKYLQKSEKLDREIMETPAGEKRFLSKAVVNQFASDLKAATAGLDPSASTQLYEKYEAIFGQKSFMKFIKQANKDGHKIPTEITIASEVASRDSKNNILQLVGKKTQIDEFYKANQGKIEDLNDTKIRESIAVKINEHGRGLFRNSQGIKDIQAQKDFTELGSTYVKYKVMQGESVSNAVEQFAKDYITSNYNQVSFGNTTVSIPTFYDNNKIQNFMKRNSGAYEWVKENIDKNNLSIPQGIAPEKFYGMLQREDGWKLNSLGDGVIYFYKDPSRGNIDLPVLRKDGSVFEVKFDNMDTKEVRQYEDSFIPGSIQKFKSSKYIDKENVKNTFKDNLKGTILNSAPGLGIRGAVELFNKVKGE